MEELVRFSITVSRDILAAFDQKLIQAGKHNRSDALRQMMRAHIASECWRKGKGQLYGTITLMYNHHVPSVLKELTSLQHDHETVIVCTTHVHVTHDTCLECLILSGDASEIRGLVDAMGQLKGIHSLDTVITSR
ncbi:MAG: nickel-responsive transcriptional regulator NikR [Synergistaceae bacterium]|nr:nickel-responsive transcriptional regulator NikR [Synergistaceae bacterium]